MLLELKRQLYTERHNNLLSLCMTVLVPLLITIGFGIGVKASTGADMPAIGGIVLPATAGLLALINSMGSFSARFNLALKMGAVRRHYVPVYMLLCAIITFALMCLSYLYTPLDKGILAAAGSNSSFDFQLPLWAAAVGSIAITLYGSWLGMLLMKYGRKGFWVAYAIFMVAVIGSSQLIPLYFSDADTGLAGVVKGVVRAAERLPGSVFTLAGLLVTAALCAHLWAMARNVAVQD